MAGAALVIGNAQYGSAFGPLVTPPNDIENLGARLRELSFDTRIFHDANQAQMANAVGSFHAAVGNLPGGASVFVYFGGHGFQRDGENYLVPVDAQGGDELALSFSCFRLSDLLASVCWRSDQQKLIALDACRTNRLPSALRDGNVGLAGVSTGRYEKVKETVILYATEPGHVAQDGAVRGASPFCRGLLEALKEPHQPIRFLTMQVTDFVCRTTGDMQTPWETGTLRRALPFVAQMEPIPRISENALVPATVSASRIEAQTAHPGTINGNNVHRLKAKDTTGRWAYYFVWVESAREAAFLAALDGEGTFDLTDYGVVIASSYGERPSDEVRGYLKGRYGFDV